MDAAGLSAHPLFREVEPALLEEVLAGSERVSVPKGGTVYDPHRFRRCLGVLLSGEVEVRRESLLVARLRAGELFGAAALFGGGDAYPTTLTALTDCALVLIPQEGVARLVRESGAFAEGYVTYLSGRIRFLSGRLDTVSADGGAGKLARYLLTAADGEGRLTLSATQLCQRLGVGRATLYRAFDALERAGAARREGRSIIITDRGRLSALCKKDENRKEDQT